MVIKNMTNENSTPLQMNPAEHGVPTTQKQQRRPSSRHMRLIRDSLRWLHDMGLFYEELNLFIDSLPPDACAWSLTEPPEHVQKNPAFENLCRLSRTAKYMPNIPKAECLPAIEIIQNASREARIKVQKHPTFNRFLGGIGARPNPFFENTMILGSVLAVEHMLDTDEMYNRKGGKRKADFAEARRRRQRQHKQQQQPTTTPCSAGGGSSSCPYNSDDEMRHICKTLGVPSGVLLG